MATIKETKALAQKIHGLVFEAKAIGYQSIANTLQAIVEQLMGWSAASDKLPPAPAPTPPAPKPAPTPSAPAPRPTTVITTPVRR